MTKIEASREIAAPPQVVYRYFDDHANAAEIFHSFSDLEWNNQTHQVGTRLKMTAKSAGIKVPFVAETTEVEPGRRVAGTFSEGMKGRWEWRFEPTEKGTRVNVKMDYELPMGILGQVADRLVVERENQTSTEKSLAIIKEKSEALYLKSAAKNPAV